MLKYIFLSLFFTSTSLFAMSPTQVAKVDDNQLSYAAAATSAFRGVVTYGGKQFVLYSLLAAGTNPGTVTVIAVSLGASYVTGYGFDKVTEYLNGLNSSPAVDKTGEDFEKRECEENENGGCEEDDDLDGFVMVENPGPTTAEWVGLKVTDIITCAYDSISGTVQNIPTTIANAVQNAPSQICASMAGNISSTIIKAVVPEAEVISVAGSAFASHIGRQTYNIFFINHTDAQNQDSPKTSTDESVDSAKTSEPTVFRYFDKLNLIDDYCQTSSM